MPWHARLINLFRGKRLHAEIDEELRYHFDARIRDNLAAGMSADEARRDAAQRFGGQLLARENARGADIVTWLESLGQDLRYAFRSLHKHSTVTWIAVGSLALGIGANTAIFSVVNAVLLRELPYYKPDRLALLWTANRLNGSQEQNTSVPNFQDWKAGSRTFEDMATYRESDGIFIDPRAPERDAEWIEYTWASGNFFNLLGRQPVAGRFFDAGEFARGDRLAVLSYALWQRRFGGSPAAIGRTVNLDGFDYRVVGVMPADFHFPARETVAWVPASAHLQWHARQTDRQARFGAVIGRLRRAATIAQARIDMNSVAEQLRRQYPGANSELGVNLVPLAVQIHGRTVPFVLAVLLGAVAIVLLIACTNAANLLLAGGAARAREMALRNALGAGRGRLVRHSSPRASFFRAPPDASGCPSLPGASGCWSAWRRPTSRIRRTSRLILRSSDSPPRSQF